MPKLEKMCNFPFELKELSESGEFTGTASPYGVKDLGDDIVEPGAFTKTIKERGSKVRLLSEHETLIGSATVTDTADGLWAKGKINLGTQAGREAYSDLKFCRDEGQPMGLSIGYQTIKADFDEKGARHLKEVSLWEISITAFPMATTALVTGVKGARKMEQKTAKTKRVDGEDLPASSFLIVGDAEDTSTWKLPWKFGSDETTAAHLRNALARFDQMTDVSEDDKKKAWAKLKRLCKEYGIEVADDGKTALSLRRELKSLLLETKDMGADDTCEAVCRICRDVCYSALWYCYGDGDMYNAMYGALADCADAVRLCADAAGRDSESIAEIAALSETLCRRAAAVCQQTPDDAVMKACAEVCASCADSCQAMSGGMEGKSARRREFKEGRMFSAANKEKMSAACEQIKSGHDTLRALLDDEAGTDDDEAKRAAAATSAPGAARETKQSEPARGHSAAESLIGDIRALIP